MEEIVREKIYAISAERVGEPPVPPHPATPQTTEHAEPQNTLAIGNIHPAPRHKSLITNHCPPSP